MKQATTPSPKKHKNPLRRIAALMLAFVLVVFGIQMGTAWYNDHYGPLGGYNLIGLNYQEKAIPSYWVNGVWGGNIFPGRPEGGGGSTCCLMLDRNAKQVTVEWQVGRTREEIDADKQIEIRSTEVTLPQIPDPKKGWLGVHFLPNDEVKITFKNFGADVLMPIKELDYGLGSIEEEKRKGQEALKREEW
jgi:hypothetical protein